MTRRAAGLAQVFRVVENDVKVCQSGGKRFGLSVIFGICMTDRADGVFVIGKLRRVAARAGQMPGAFRRRGIVLALVAERARKTRVFRV